MLTATVSATSAHTCRIPIRRPSMIMNTTATAATRKTSHAMNQAAFSRTCARRIRRRPRSSDIRDEMPLRCHESDRSYEAVDTREETTPAPRLPHRSNLLNGPRRAAKDRVRP